MSEVFFSRACYSGQVSVVEYLLKKGADFNLTNHFGISPLEVAVMV